MNNLFKLNKKILIISSWAPPMIGGPQNLYNLFSNINKNDYFILTSVINILKNTKQSGSRLPCKYFFYNNEDFFKYPDNPFLALAKKIFNMIRTPLYLILRGFSIIKKENTKLLLGISDNGPTLFFTFLLSKLSRRPYALYLYDLYKGNNFPFPWKTISNFFEPILFRNAKKIIVTNEGTKQYYIERYGESISFEVVHNSVDAESYSRTQSKYDPKPPFTIIFTGHVYWAQERSVRNLIKAVSEMNGIDVKLHLYIPNPPKDLVESFSNHPKIKFDSAPQSEMPDIQSKADILFLPLAWHTPSPQIIATASPGKLTDYLAAGRPILIHAPPYAYVSQYARQYHFAHIVDEEDVTLLQNGIKKILTDIEYSRELIANARKTFHQNHDAVKNAELLKKIINEL